MTENIYQALRPFIPEDPSLPDTRSVHFLSFPEVKEEYFDSDIERQVKRMQSVIELTRYLREKNNLSLKVRRTSLPSACSTDSMSRRRSRSSSFSTPRRNTVLRSMTEYTVQTSPYALHEQQPSTHIMWSATTPSCGVGYRK